MKKLINICLVSFLAATATSVSAKNADNKENTNSNSTATVAVYNNPAVSADEAANGGVTYNVFATNTFADDAFSDDVKDGDVLVADVIAVDPSATTGSENITVVNPTAGMTTREQLLNIKTGSKVRLVYYTEPHTDKTGNIINGGLNTLKVEQVIAPGVYSCRYEGFDGKIATVKVVCKK